jgi:hypothetical protein
MKNKKGRFTIIVSMIIALSGLGMVQQNAFAGKCPCDIYKDGGTPCVAAHSVVRALYSTYNGPLYQVRLKSDTTKKKDIYPLTPGGYASAATVDSFLKGTTGGTVSKIYDQSEKKNDLTVSLWGSAVTHILAETPATRSKDTISKRIVYPLATESGEGYRNNHTNGVATGAQPEGMYVVASGTHVNNGCCWDYGNAESDADAGGKKTGVMEALYFGSSCWFSPCNGSGPWMFADLEWGLFQGTATNGTTNASLPYQYVSGFLKGDKTTYTIRANDATLDVLKLMGSTTRPAPNLLTGAIVLAIGGDSAPSGRGTFFEGVMTIGRPSDTTEDAVQKNISFVYAGKDTITTSFRRTAPAIPTLSFKVSCYSSKAGSVISYVLPEAGRVHLNVFDQEGRQVAGLVNYVVPAGSHQAVWDASRVPAGVYFWKIAVDSRNEGTGKIIVGK